MFKKSLLVIFVLLMLTGISYQAGAQNYNYPANTGPFGIGIILGEPTGIVAKYWLTTAVSLDAEFAWSFSQGGFIYTQLDAQYTPLNIVQNQNFRIPFYIGAGARLRFNGAANTNNILGVLIPLGVNFNFSQIPVDAFIEIGPGVDVFPNFNFFLSGGVGARYYF